MNLLYVSNSRFPSERAHMVQTVQMCNAFAGQGHDVTLAVTNRPTAITESAESYYGTQLQFQIVRVPVFDLAERAGRSGTLIARFLYSLQRLSFVWKLPPIKTFDVIYGRDPMILYLLGRRVGFQKIVYESHEAHDNFFVRRLVKKEVKVVAISEGIKVYYEKKGVPSKQLCVAHDGIDESFFATPPTKQKAREQLGLPADKRIAMYIGGFDAWKGVETFFAASTHVTDVLFVAIGGKPQELPTLQQKYPHVAFLGPRPYRELSQHQQAADVLVVPNTAKTALSAEYTSPLKLFAHMSSGVPLVVSDLPSMRSVVSDAEVFFFAPDDPQSLGAVVSEVFKNPAEAHKRAAAAKQRAANYTWQQRTKEIIGFIAS